jgi:ribosome-associated protein
MDGTTLRINDSLDIPITELSFRASRSGGPGGQHVNTSSTRVELVWDVANSPSLAVDQRERILTKLSGRISGEGLLSLASSTSRSQHRNREDVTARFIELVRDALRIPKPRRKTKPSKASRDKRLADKRRRSETKKMRGRPVSE